jgi:methoxymalonate biosynthesis acyl carrier protein
VPPASLDDAGVKIRQFLSRYYKGGNFGDEDDIFALGFVNSMLAMQLILFVEKEFLLTVENDDLDLDNFRSVASIIRFVTRKRGASA